MAARSPVPAFVSFYCYQNWLKRAWKFCIFKLGEIFDLKETGSIEPGVKMQLFFFAQFGVDYYQNWLKWAWKFCIFKLGEIFDLKETESIELDVKMQKKKFIFRSTATKIGWNGLGNFAFSNWVKYSIWKKLNQLSLVSKCKNFGRFWRIGLLPKLVKMVERRQQCSSSRLDHLFVEYSNN